MKDKNQICFTIEQIRAIISSSKVLHDKGIGSFTTIAKK